VRVRVPPRAPYCKGVIGFLGAGFFSSSAVGTPERTPHPGKAPFHLRCGVGGPGRSRCSTGRKPTGSFDRKSRCFRPVKRCGWSYPGRPVKDETRSRSSTVLLTRCFKHMGNVRSWNALASAEQRAPITRCHNCQREYTPENALRKEAIGTSSLSAEPRASPKKSCATGFLECAKRH
jgi:hypothetical protein